MVSALSGKEGVCLIEVVSVEWLWEQPWKRCQQERSTGTGFVITGKRILTNAHVIKSAIDIRVRQHGSPRRFPARVLVYAPDVDLALIEIEGDEQTNEFFQLDEDSSENGEALALDFADDLPALQESVHVVGFPSGGRTICVTEGVVSRIDNISLASGGDTILAVQIDAAINPGNSGGPAFNSEGLVTGVAFCKSADESNDNIGYLIPVVVVLAFLGRCRQDGTYTLSPSVPYQWHSLENCSLRLAHGVPHDVHGILLTNVSPTTNGALRKGDVLTKIDGKPIADDGQVTLRGSELIQHRYLLRGKRLDEATNFSVYRDGVHIESEPCVLKHIPRICPTWAGVDHMPDYLILGALVLIPLFFNLTANEKAGTRLIGSVYDWMLRWPGDWDDKEELVVLTDIFAHELSFSYTRSWRRVTAYNGTPVRSLRHLRDMWEESCAAAALPESPPSFARIELEHDDDVVFEVKAAIAAQSAILETHQITKAFNICGRNLKYI